MPIDTVPLNLATLPAMIAGPIVRRVTRTKASIWFATRVAGQVTLEVWPSGRRAQSQQATTTPTKCGANLWVGVGSIDGFDGAQNDEFTASVIYEYEFTSASWSAGSSPTWSQLAYGVATHPSFIGVPNQLADLHMAHASCRMPHGAFRDGLGALDARVLTNPTKRPRILLLSGDQIYADAVAGPLIPRLRRIATDLVGVSESGVFPALPLIDGRQELTAVSDSGTGFGLTSSEAENHLWLYEEFVAMYLLVWSDVLWPTSTPRWSDMTPATDIDPNASLDEATWNELADRLEQFRLSLPAVRRLLANTPTLMVFDDHEITDDWNLNHDWCTRVYGNAAGARLVLNGLIAYTLFQHWGNVPDRFTTAGTPEASFLGAVRTAQGEPNWTTIRPLVGVPINVPNAVGDLRALDATSIRFDLTIGPADGWPAQIVLLDERTARRLDPSLDAAGRISTTAIDQMLPAPPAAPTTPIVVVAPAPVLGLNLLENQAQPLLSLLPEGDESFDYEPWAASSESFEHLLSQLAAFGQAVVLSGDVHFGFTMELQYRAPAAAVAGRAAQLVSSGAKRAESKTIALHVFGDLMRKLGLVRTRSYRGYTQLTNSQRASFSSPPGGNSSLQYDDVTDILLGRVFREAQKTPAVFTADVASAYGLPPGDWEYDVLPIDDNTVPTAAAEPVLAADLAAAASVAPWQGWNPVNSYTIVRGMQAADLWRIGHVFVGISQVALISFGAGPPTSAVYRILASTGESAALGTEIFIDTDVPLS